MISVWGERFNGELHRDVPPRHNKSIQDALNSLVKYELGYGGRVANIFEVGENIQIKTVTQVLACIDTTWFEGSREEMLPLVTACHLWSQVVQKGTPEGLIDQLMKVTEGNPMLLTMTAPLLIGGSRVKGISLLAMGATEEELTYLCDQPMGTEDMMTVLSISREMNVPVQEVVAQL
jgi:hypothetical protein